jgi:hypothetical protein
VKCAGWCFQATQSTVCYESEHLVQVHPSSVCHESIRGEQHINQQMRCLHTYIFWHWFMLHTHTAIPFQQLHFNGVVERRDRVANIGLYGLDYSI